MIRLAIIVALWLGGISAAGAQLHPWGDLSAWIGKYPTDTDGPRPRHFLQSGPIAHELHVLLDPADLVFLNQLEVESPIRSTNGLIVAAVCMAHDCAANHAIIVMDPVQPRMFVGIQRSGAQRYETKWVKNDPGATLPPAILHDFAQ